MSLYVSSAQDGRGPAVIRRFAEGARVRIGDYDGGDAHRTLVHEAIGRRKAVPLRGSRAVGANEGSLALRAPSALLTFSLFIGLVSGFCLMVSWRGPW